MKKITIALIGFCVTIVILLIVAVVLSFTLLKKNMDNLTRAQRDKLTTIINIPNAVPPSNPTFNSITYTWEMETLQKEVTGVNITQTTGLNRADNSVFVVLEKTTGGDASVFDKVLPSVIKDQEVLAAASKEEKIINLENGKTGFKRASIQKDDNGKLSKIVWEFEKQNFGEDANLYIGKVNSLPDPVIKSLYAIQSLIITAFSTQ